MFFPETKDGSIIPYGPSYRKKHGGISIYLRLPVFIRLMSRYDLRTDRTIHGWHTFDAVLLVRIGRCPNEVVLGVNYFWDENRSSTVLKQ